MQAIAPYLFYSNRLHFQTSAVRLIPYLFASTWHALFFHLWLWYPNIHYPSHLLIYYLYYITLRHMQRMNCSVWSVPNVKEPSTKEDGHRKKRYTAIIHIADQPNELSWMWKGILARPNLCSFSNSSYNDIFIKKSNICRHYYKWSTQKFHLTWAVYK